MSTLDTGGHGTYFIHKRLKHSEKPPIVRDWIVKWSGDLPRIELFARQRTDGWDVWGNEVDKFNEVEPLFKSEEILKGRRL